MIDLDAYLLEFVRTNIVSLGLAGTILTILARNMGWTWLVEIIDALRARVRGNVPDRPTGKNAAGRTDPAPDPPDLAD